MSKWEHRLFSEVLSIINGKNQKAVVSPDGKYPIYGSGGIMGWANDYICNENTIIIGRKGSINKPIFVAQKFWNVDTAFGLAANQNLLLPRYLYYFCVLFDFEKLNTTVTIPSLTKANLLKVKIPLPPLSEQKRIADILDKAAELISLRKQQLEQLDILVKSPFIAMFGDPVTNEKEFPQRKLADFYPDDSDGVKCGPFGSALKKGEYVDKGVPVWNMDNISKTGKFRNTPHLWITEEKFNKLSSYAVKNGDIIISRAGTVGKMCVVNSTYPKSIISTNLIRVRLNSNLSPLFVVTLIMTFGSRVCRLRTGNDDAFSYMNTGVLNSVMFPYPPLKLQNEFAEFVEKVEQQKALMQSGLEKLELNHKALMVEFF